MIEVDKKELDKKVWKLFDSVRGTIDDFGGLLYLIVLHRMGLYKSLFDKNINSNKVFRLKDISDLEIVMLDYAQSVFGQSLENLQTHFLKDFEQILDKVTDKEAEEIFEYVLARYSEMSGKVGFISAPTELVQSLNEILKPNPKSSVFNPFSGVGGFLKSLPEDVRFYGQEVNRRSFTICLLRLKVAGKLGVGTIKLTDSVVNWPNNRFDRVISFPPFNMKLNNEQREITGYRYSNSFIIDKTIDSLSENGRAIIVLPNSWLFGSNKNDQRQKKFLVETGLLETIISFPTNLLDNTGISFSVIVIDNGLRNTGTVNFIDATELVESKSTFRKKFIHQNELLRTYESKIDSNYKRIVKKQEIAENNFNLIASRYFIDKSEGVKLKDLLRPIKNKKFIKKGEKGRLIKISELKNENETPFIKMNEIEVKELKTSGYEIDQKALLIASTFKNLKPSILAKTDLYVVVSRNISAFEVTSASVDMEFLALELRKDYVRKQVEKLQGGNIPRIKIDDILRIKVEIPSFDEQKAIVKSYSELTSKIEKLESDKERLLEGNQKAEFDQFASLKHTLGRPRENILDWSDNLLHFFIENEKEAKVLSKKFESFYEYKLTDVFKELKNDIAQITNILEKGEEVLNVEKYDLSIVGLQDVVRLINKLSSNNCKFKIEKQFLIEDKLKQRGILANKTLLRTLFDNILTNANKYAFDEHSEQNTIQIILRDESDQLLLIVRDNGVGFPNNFSKEQFIQKFKTNNSDKGSGLGGYHIDLIARRFRNSDWKLNLNKDPFYKVEFVFNFEIKPI